MKTRTSAIFVFILISVSLSVAQIQDTTESESLAAPVEFEKEVRTKILKKQGKYYLYFDLSLKKVNDEIYQVYLNKNLIFDRLKYPVDKNELKNIKEYKEQSFVVKHSFLHKDSDKETWTEDKIRMKGRFLMDTLLFSGEYKVLFDAGNSSKEIIVFDRDKSWKNFIEFKGGLSLNFDRIYYDEEKYKPLDLLSDWAALNFYSLGYGFRHGDYSTGVRVFYDGYDDDGKHDNVKFRKHIYWWEFCTFIGRKFDLSFDSKIELEAGYKFGKIRRYYYEDSIEVGSFAQPYNFTFRDHGLSIGASFGYRNVGIEYNYSGTFDGYHTVAFHNWIAWNDASHVGTSYKFITGDNVREFQVLLDVRGVFDGVSWKNEGGWLNFSSFALGVITLAVEMWDGIERIAGGRRRD